MKSELERIKENLEIVFTNEILDHKVQKAKSENRPLRIKIGFDPTSPDLHLGHFVLLRKLKAFQDIGHKICVIIGDFTARIGDPSGKNKTRPPLKECEIIKNAETYINQLALILDVTKIELHHNTEWYKGFKTTEIYDLFSKYTLNQILVRDDFANRLKNGVDIASHEIMYPLLQGYDSVKINADIEIGGTDQLFNMKVGRYLQETSGIDPQAVICVPILRGLDGENKMSKSLRNYIGITESAQSISEKIINMPNLLIEEYISLLTDFSREEKDNLKSIAALDTLKVKRQIADNIIYQLGSK